MRAMPVRCAVLCHAVAGWRVACAIVYSVDGLASVSHRVALLVACEVACRACRISGGSVAIVFRVDAEIGGIGIAGNY
jgi:hypothetical protein